VPVQEGCLRGDPKWLLLQHRFPRLRLVYRLQSLDHIDFPGRTSDDRFDRQTIQGQGSGAEILFSCASDEDGDGVCARVIRTTKTGKVAREGCEVDHLVSRELGGADALPNLWPQPYNPKPGAHEKDWLENELHKEVCHGLISLEDAQQEIRTDWYAAYLKRKR
jgi:hypothetical protein